MDIDLLAKMIRDVVLEKDEVALPGLGMFIADFVPASFSDKGYTINPPYKRLSFRQKDNPDDRTIVKLYAEANNIGEDTAEHFVNDFLSGLKDILMVRKSVVLPGLGRLRATKENNFFFIADENLDIYPEGFGLEPVSLKTHQETVSEVAETMAGLRSILAPEQAEEPALAQEPVLEPVAASESVQEPAPEVIQEAEPEVATETEVAPEPAPEVEPALEVESAPEVEPASEVEPGPEALPEPVQEAVPETASETVPETSQEIVPETVLESVCESVAGQPADNQSGGSSFWKTFRIIAVTIVILAIISLAAFIILSRVAPDFIDTILYSPEELEIVRKMTAAAFTLR
ncbi:MAG: hypothetical protein MR793_09915 [Bacteroidales bacterium]|nr:hypothetical protein [Bacteroidales bacterium]